MSIYRRSQSPSYDPDEEVGGPQAEDDGPVVHQQHSYLGSHPPVELSGSHLGHPPVELSGSYLGHPPVELSCSYLGHPPVELSGSHLGSHFLPVETFGRPPIAYEEPYQAAITPMSEHMKHKAHLESRLLELEKEEEKMEQDMADEYDKFINLPISDPRHNDIQAYMHSDKVFQDNLRHRLLSVQDAIRDTEHAIERLERKIERPRRKTAHYSDSGRSFS